MFVNVHKLRKMSLSCLDFLWLVNHSRSLGVQLCRRKMFMLLLHYRYNVTWCSYLGFSLPCVTIWEWNIINTKEKCLEVLWTLPSFKKNYYLSGKIHFFLLQIPLLRKITFHFYLLSHEEKNDLKVTWFDFWFISDIWNSISQKKTV